jgi:hypothetical protein
VWDQPTVDQGCATTEAELLERSGPLLPKKGRQVNATLLDPLKQCSLAQKIDPHRVGLPVSKYNVK